MKLSPRYWCSPHPVTFRISICNFCITTDLDDICYVAVAVKLKSWNPTHGKSAPSEQRKLIPSDSPARAHWVILQPGCTMTPNWDMNLGNPTANHESIAFRIWFSRIIRTIIAFGKIRRAINILHKSLARYSSTTLESTTKSVWNESMEMANDEYGWGLFHTLSLLRYHLVVCMCHMKTWRYCILYWIRAVCVVIYGVDRKGSYRILSCGHQCQICW